MCLSVRELYLAPQAQSVPSAYSDRSPYLHENLCSEFLREAGTAHLLVNFLVNCDEILYWWSALSAGQVRFIFVCKGYHLQHYI